MRNEVSTKTIRLNGYVKVNKNDEYRTELRKWHVEDDADLARTPSVLLITTTNSFLATLQIMFIEIIIIKPIFNIYVENNSNFKRMLNIPA